MISSRNLAATLFALTQILACSKQGTQLESAQTANIFSNRPVSAMQDLFIVTFASPALADAGMIKDGKFVVSDEARAKVLAEQAAFETKLKALAPDAQIIYRYRLILNAVAVLASTDIENMMSNVPGIASVRPASQMERSEELNVRADAPAPGKVNSVNFIGGDLAHQAGYTGTGVRVGVIDTGIDYTHAMLGGSGRPEDYKNIDPKLPTAAFPNDKVVGGIDLVGSDYDASSPNLSAHVPHIDSNPLDEEGHGTHVSGTIAGRGDGVKTYDGVAPDAKLYAIKVFGKEGSTSDAAILAGLEYAADPSQSLNPSSHLDVVNLSLGSSYGQAQTLFSVAVGNLAKTGTTVVVSAGNAGPTDYIVGSPSTTNEALSVAASVDGSSLNWKFAAVRITTSDGQALLAKVNEGDFTKPVSQTNVSGELVDLGMADKDLTDDQKSKVQGKVAFIERGIVPFTIKIQRAVDAGAIGVLMYDNQPGVAGMKGDGKAKFSLPAVFISQALGQQVKASMAHGTVKIEFNSPQTIDEPQSVDTITAFSSKGPRSEDSLIKPEIAAPGQNITSAAMGKGTEGVTMNGTSMAGPHMTGTMALMKQAHPGLNTNEMKSVVMNTAKILSNIPITLQGAGRVQLVQAINAQIVSESPSLSLGRVEVTGKKTLSREVTLRNLSDSEQTLQINGVAMKGMTITAPSSVTVPAKGTAKITVNFTLALDGNQSTLFELDGRLLLSQNNHLVLQIPAMAIQMRASQIQASGDAQSGSLTLLNPGNNPGVALAFNLLGEDQPKEAPTGAQAWKNRDCDLHTAGYRILRKNGPQGTVDVIQFAFELYQPVTTWDRCAVSVLIDSKGTGVADQEIASVVGGLEGVRVDNATVLLDAARARNLRFTYEQQINAGVKGARVDYTPAVQAVSSLLAFSQSSLVIVEAPLEKLNLTADGKLNVKLAAQAESQNNESVQPDKYLVGNTGSWIKISPKAQDQAYSNMEEATSVTGTGASVNLVRGSGQEPLVMYYPLNSVNTTRDALAQIVR